MTLPKLTKKFVDFSAKFSFDKVEGALLEEGEGENGGKEIREKLRKCTRFEKGWRDFSSTIFFFFF